MSSLTSVEILVALRDALTAAIDSIHARAQLEVQLRESEEAHAATRRRLGVLRDSFLLATAEDAAMPSLPTASVAPPPLTQGPHTDTKSLVAVNEVAPQCCVCHERAKKVDSKYSPSGDLYCLSCWPCSWNPPSLPSDVVCLSPQLNNKSLVAPPTGCIENEDPAHYCNSCGLPLYRATTVHYDDLILCVPCWRAKA